MIIIAFSTKTTKIIPHLLCRKWKHVAPIIPNKDKLIMYQFVKHNHIEKISISMRDIAILRKYGWKFIYVNKNPVYDFDTHHVYTCVQFTKYIIRMSDWRVQTPDGLHKKLQYLMY